MRRGAVLAFSGLFCVIGVAIIVETAVVGGQLGYAFGVLFVLAGALRAYLTFSAAPRRSSPNSHERDRRKAE